MPNKKYTNEFKKEAVKLALESDSSKSEIADNIGVKYTTLCTWIKQSMVDPMKSDNPIDYKSRYQELVTQNNQLKKDLKQAKLEREILKKAAAYFAKQNM